MSHHLSRRTLLQGTAAGALASTFGVSVRAQDATPAPAAATPGRQPVQLRTDHHL